MALALTSISPTVVSADGAERLVLTGTFPLNTPIYVYVGTTGTVNDAPCYSGVPNQGAACISLNGTTLRCFAPLLALQNTPYNVLAVAPALGQQALLAAGLGVRPSFFYAQVFAIRSVLPSNYATGPRNLDAEPPP